MKNVSIPFEEILHSVPIGIVLLHKGEVVYANTAALSLFGYPSQDKLPSETFLEINLSSFKAYIQNYREQQWAKSDWFRIETQGVNASGEPIEIEVLGKVRNNHEQYDTILVVRNIGEQKQEEREQAEWLKEQETITAIDYSLLHNKELETVLSTINQQLCRFLKAHWAGVIIVDEQAYTIRWAGVVGATTQFPKEPFTITSAWKHILWLSGPQFCTKDNREALCFLKDILEVMSEGIFSVAIVPLRKENVPKGCLLVGYRNHHKFSSREAHLLREVAERLLLAILNSQLYKELVDRERELIKFTSVRIHAQEEERRKIARELHDTLGQLLTATKFNVELLEDTFQPTSEQKDRIIEIKRLLDNVLQATRELSYNLMPSVLDDFGLVPALQVLCDQVAQRTGYKISVHTHNMNQRLKTELEVGLYRIVQDSLLLFQKYDGVFEIDIQLINSPDLFRLLIDGTQQNQHSIPREVPTFSEFDIMNIRERATLMGGTVVVDFSSAPTITICVEIPYTQQKDNCDG
ncbi:MAG: histidine kinase [Bacteroidetes bacterium]|nr:histidine kinase [Bacteroidota bacterium]